MAEAMLDDEAPIGPSTVAQRIRAAADRLEEAREAFELAKERRDDAIIAGRDEGALGYAQLARYARISKSRVIAILGGG